MNSNPPQKSPEHNLPNCHQNYPHQKSLPISITISAVLAGCLILTTPFTIRNSNQSVKCSTNSNPSNNHQLKNKLDVALEMKAVYLSEKYNRPYNEVLDIVQSANEAASLNENELNDSKLNTLQLNENLLLAIAIAESSLNPYAKNGTSHGLMQINKTSGVFPENPYNIDESISAAVKLLTATSTLDNGSDKSLHIYNVGETAYARGKRNHRYVRKVKAIYKELDEL